MELERLEVVFDGDLSPFEQKLEAMQGKLDTILGRVKQTASSGVGSIEKNFNNTKSFDKFTQQLEKMNANFEKQLNRTNQTANKQGEQIGQAMSNGVSKGTVKMTKDVQTALDKINTQMQQAKAAQQRIANLQADKNGANLSGDTKGASKIGEKIAKAQIQMNKSQQQAQAIVRGLKSEYDAIALMSVSELKKVSPDYPNTWSQLPAAIYSTKAKPHKYDLSEDEKLTEWTVKVDLYGNQSLTTIQQKIIETMKGIGFKNIEANDMNNETFKRALLTFRGIVDNSSLFVYQ